MIPNQWLGWQHVPLKLGLYDNARIYMGHVPAVALNCHSFIRREWFLPFAIFSKHLSYHYLILGSGATLHSQHSNMYLNPIDFQGLECMLEVKHMFKYFAESDLQNTSPNVMFSKSCSIILYTTLHNCHNFTYLQRINALWLKNMPELNIFIYIIVFW